MSNANGGNALENEMQSVHPDPLFFDRFMHSPARHTFF